MYQVNKITIIIGLHELLSHDSFLNGNHFKWMEHVEDIFNNLGLTDIWLIRNYFIKLLLELVKAKTSRGKRYVIFVLNSILKKSLILLPKVFWNTLLKFRSANHDMHIETGRWSNTSVEYRTCPLFLYLFTCILFVNSRQSYI